MTCNRIQFLFLLLCISQLSVAAELAHEVHGAAVSGEEYLVESAGRQTYTFAFLGISFEPERCVESSDGRRVTLCGRDENPVPLLAVRFRLGNPTLSPLTINKSLADFVIVDTDGAETRELNFWMNAATRAATLPALSANESAEFLALVDHAGTPMPRLLRVGLRGLYQPLEYSLARSGDPGTPTTPVDLAGGPDLTPLPRLPGADGITTADPDAPSPTDLDAEIVEQPGSVNPQPVDPRDEPQDPEIPQPPALWGMADLHNHQFANLGFGGTFFHGEAFNAGGGVAAALPHCGARTRHGPAGVADNVGNILRGKFGHLVGGFPEFDGWPRWDTVNHQQVYVDWLKRAVDGGLRLMVVRAVDSEVLCNVMGRRFACDNMAAVERQVRAAFDLQDFIDARNGGPGQGWYRIATTAAEAREAVSQGKLAVVLGVEVADLLNCADGGCTPAQVSSRLRALHSLGVRDVTPIHNLDNPFGATAIYNPLFQIGNLTVNGTMFALRDCAADGFEFRLDFAPSDTGQALEQMAALFGYAELPRLAALTKAMGAHCNARGLTPLGEHLLVEMMDLGMIIDVDHMSGRSIDQALTIAEQYADGGYPVVSSHPGFQDTSRHGNNHEGQRTRAQLARIRALGGLVAPILSQGDELVVIREYQRDGRPGVEHTCAHSSRSYAQAYLYAIDQMQGPVALGTDLNGLVHNPAPRYAGDEHSAHCNGDAAFEIIEEEIPDELRDELSRDGELPRGTRFRRPVPQGPRVRYPFRSHDPDGRDPLGSVSFDRMRVRERVFDINVDGLAQVGMLPDFIEDLKMIGVSNTDLQPLFDSADAYIRLWERIESLQTTPGGGVED